MIIINNWQQVPKFQNEIEEQTFWTTHVLSDELINTFSDERPSHLPTPRKRTMYSSVNLPIEVDIDVQINSYLIKRKMSS